MRDFKHAKARPRPGSVAVRLPCWYIASYRDGDMSMIWETAIRLLRLYFWLLVFLFHTAGTFLAFRVFDNARRRYAHLKMPIRWAIAHYPAWMVAFYFYRKYRPPVINEGAPRLAGELKFVIWIISLALIVVALFLIVNAIALRRAGTGYPYY